MTTLKLENKEFIGEFIPFYNNCGYYFKLENGEFLSGLFKQGYTGKKEIELLVTFNFHKKFMYTVNNSNRQVKDSNAYFLRFKD
jgi:hypothetical protein